MASLLERLIDPGFEAEVVAATPRLLRVRLSHTPEVEELRKGLREGTLTDDVIREFVESLLVGNTAGDRFPYEIALASIAVALEIVYNTFSDEYLHDLSRIRSARFRSASLVAQECLRIRSSAIGSERRDFKPLATLEFQCVTLTYLRVIGEVPGVSRERFVVTPNGIA